MKLWDPETQYYMGKRPIDYFVLLSHHRNSGILQESNWIASKKILDEKNCDYEVFGCSHWLVGWVESIIIHQSEIESIDIANDIYDSIKEYPILDEELFSNMEYDLARDIAIDMIKYDNWKGKEKDCWLNECVDYVIYNGLVEV
jgi:hypothetical protein